MSKYHKGDKFIVEIKEVMNSDNGTLYRSDFKTLTFDDNGLDKLQKYNEPTISEDTLEMERMKALNDGRNEVWEWLKKFGKMRANEAKRLYGYNGELWEIFDNFTPQEVLEKLEAYEKEQEEKRKAEEMAIINVGDVVEYDGVQAVVMDIDLVDNVALFTENACIESWLPQCTCKKTGKHIDIQSILQQIGSDADELS